ncbi:MAG: insulinase family protein [Verrucomicrobiae bacterium]|nr:insulinase family protein [Verrucomicrobiae bacterium]NNJ42711.1 insulinase family protein [Akkermansiaceae bacterium]
MSPHLTLALVTIALFSASCRDQSCSTTPTPATSKHEAGSVRPWAQDTSDIPSDAKVTYGHLPNGMRYILLPNQQPPGRVSMRLHIAAGSLMERDDQRGVAHFLEHMVFNGSKNFPDASKLIPQMQRLGIAFGAHANAYTSFDETVYMLDLPNNQADTLKLGFDVMRDFGDGAFLRNEEIDKERGVILSEKTTRDSVKMRLMEKQFDALLPDALIAKRFPIGTEEIIQSAPRSAFADFYTQYYTPNRMTFIYVGDFDAKEAEKRIRSTFASMENPSQPGTEPDLGKIPSGHGFKTLMLSDQEVATTDLTLLALKPFQEKPDTKANRGDQLPINLAHAILSRRFSILAKKENAPISEGNAFHQNLFKFMKLGGLSVNAKNHDWKAALPILEQELRRAIEHGFTASELTEAKANLVNGYERAVKAAPSRKTNTLASSLAQHIHKQAVFSTPEDDLSILRKNLANVTPQTCHLALKEFWDTQDITLILTTNTPVDDADAELTQRYQTSQQSIVTAPEKKDTAEFAYANTTDAGQITHDRHIKDLDLSQITFHNGCRCNFKKTDFTQNAISLTTRVGGGKLTMPKDKLGLDIFASSILTAGGLGKHSTDDLKSILAGRNAGVGFQVGEDAFILNGSTTPDDLELQLQLLCAYLTDPGLRPEAERLFKAQLPAIFSQMKHTPAGPQSKMTAFLRGDDPRFTFPTMDQAQALTTQDVKSWVAPALKNDYLELSIVGDFDPNTLRPLLARTIGALPARASTKPAYTTERTLANLPTPPAEKRYTFESRIPTGSAIVFWKSIGLSQNTIGTTRRLGILSSILSNRMREKIREELGEAYSPYAGSQPSDTYTNLGYMLAVSPGKPDQAERVGKLIIDIADKLATEGATQDELDRALAPRLSTLKKSLRQNAYWLGTVMSQSQQQPYRLDWARTRDADYQRISLQEINNLARQYLGNNNAIRFEIIPQ